MKVSVCRLISALALAAAAAAMVPGAQAQCAPNIKGLKPMSWQAGAGRAHLLQAAFGRDDEFEAPTIVGMWQVIFTAKTLNGQPIPDMVIDKALVVWHRDKTEIMNSSRPPQDGNFCLGVWERTGERSYALNHFAIGNEYTPGTSPGIVGQPIGGVHIREQVTVGPEGRHFTGTFTLDQYNTSGQKTIGFTGTLKATRITLESTPGEVF